MTLAEKREQWERGGFVELVAVHNIDGYKTVFVIVGFEKDISKKYQLLRYFKIGDNWEVSVDKEGTGVDFFEEACVHLTGQFNDLLPKEEKKTFECSDCQDTFDIEQSFRYGPDLLCGACYNEELRETA